MIINYRLLCLDAALACRSIRKRLSGGRTPDQPAAPGFCVIPHGGAPMMNTVVPTDTRLNSSSDCHMCMRMHPWEAYVPIE